MVSTKHIVSLLVALFCLTSIASAQTKQQKKDSGRDFLSVSAALGYQTFQNTDPTLYDKPGAAAQIGFGYRRYQNHFLFTVGLEAQYGLYTLGSENAVMNFDMVDSQGDPFTMNAIITDRKDLIPVFDAKLPIMFGGEWNRFYFLLGAKGGLSAFGSAITEASLTATAQYNRFAGVFQDMPNHQLFTNQPLRSNKQPIAFKPQVYGTAEVGVRFGTIWKQTGADIPHATKRYYLAAFAEYGILNMHKMVGEGLPVTPRMDDEGNMLFEVTPVYNTLTYRDAVVRNLFVGLKFTALFEMPKGGKCVICKERKFGGPRFKW